VISTTPASRTGSAREAVAATVAGGALAAVTGSLVGLAAPAAVVGGLNGYIGGRRGVYGWRTPKGVAAFVLDSTWALVSTAASLVSHGVAAAQRDPGYSPELSHRHNRHVYARGLQLRRGFAITFGGVVNGAGDLSRPRRVKLITDHEDVHVWQSRWFGPAYVVLYTGWMAGGAMAGALAWLVTGRTQPLAKSVETYAYYLNPFEWWAYSRDDFWPPTGKLDGVGWKRPAVRSFSSSGSR
jgi:hypothetical protein